jgi:hypothetical protein
MCAKNRVLAGPGGSELERALSKIRAYIKLARPTEWVKNTFVFPALLASGEFTESGSIWLTLVAFASFSFVSSGIYCLNDSVDYKSDKKHPVKRHRPIAAGLITPRAGRIAGVCWIVVGTGLSSVAGSFGLTGVLGLYMLLQVAYNAGLKRMAAVDVIVLSLGFVLRAWAGAVAIGVPASLWLLACVFCLCLYLALVKRLCDLSSVEREPSAIDPGQGWRSDAGYVHADELNWMLSVSAACAIACYLMYSMSDHAIAAARGDVRGLVLLTPVVMLAMFRMYRAALRGTYDSPFAIVVSDPIVVICSCVFALGSGLFLTSVTLAGWMQNTFGS